MIENREYIRALSLLSLPSLMLSHIYALLGTQLVPFITGIVPVWAPLQFFSDSWWKYLNPTVRSGELLGVFSFERVGVIPS